MLTRMALCCCRSRQPFPKGLRALLATLGEIWPEAAGQVDATLTDRRAHDDAAVRKAYLRAVRMVHPDKLSGVEEVERRVLAQKIFALLSEKFSEESQD